MLFAAVFVLCVAKAAAYSSGAPTSVCNSLTPGHGEADLNPSPYFIEVQNVGSDYLVTITSITSDIDFQGFILQARTPGGTVVGRFEPSSPDDAQAKQCTNPADTLTHTNAKNKRKVEVTWNPYGYSGPVIFIATVARTKQSYWKDITKAVTVSSNGGGQSSTEPNFTPTTSSPSTEFEPFYDDCHYRKSCFGFPSGCISRKNCRGVVAVTVEGDVYQFELKAKGPTAWIGVGLSDDASMGADSVIECVKSSNGIRVYSSYTQRPPEGYDAIRERNSDYLQLKNSSTVDGGIYCTVWRDVRSIVRGRVFDLAREQYHLLLAAGESVESNKVDFHTLFFTASGEKKFLSDVSETLGASKLFVRLHGAFMLTAWIGTAAVGMLLARYYRQTWVGSQLCGKDQWFAWHRFFMVITWCLTMVGFVLIFLELRDWSHERNPHAILGTVTTALCFFQPIGAYFRPHPGTKRRWIFNWGHWFFGNAAHIIAIVTIFYAVQLTKAELPDFLTYIVVTYVAFHVLIHLVLSVMGFVSERSAKSRINSIPMKEMGSSGRSSMYNDHRNDDAPHSVFRKFILGIYILVVILFVVAMVVIVVLAPIEEYYENNIRSMFKN